jgi:hypothetical protein
VADLMFGLLPKKRTVKVTIELPEPLKEELDAYRLNTTSFTNLSKPKH